MNKCCHDTFISALAEILIFIKQSNPDITQLIRTLEFAIKELEKKENGKIQI